MRKKLFYIACFLCAGSIVPTTVFGKEPTNAELFNIAKEAYEKGFWKPDFDAYKFGRQETCAIDGLQDIKGNADLLAVFEKTYACWVRLTKEAYRLYGFDIRMSILRVWFEDLEKILLQEDDSEWNKVKPLLKGFGKGSLVRNLKREFEYDPVAGIKSEVPNADAFSAFFLEKMAPFLKKEQLDFDKSTDAVGGALSEFGDAVRSTQSILKKCSKKTDLTVFFSIMETFDAKKAALLRSIALPHPLAPNDTIQSDCGADHFLKILDKEPFIQQLETMRKKTAFTRFKSHDLSKIPNDYNIFGLDKKYVKYSNPFKDPDIDREVESCVQKALEPYTAKFKDAYEEIGITMEGWLQRALQDVNNLSINAWCPHTRFDFEPVMKQFDKVVAMYDINNEIFRETPKLDLSQRSEASLLLEKNAIFLASEAVKGISDACGARFENTVMKHCQSIVTTLRALLSHYFSLVKTIRQIESEELAMSIEEAREIVAHWLLERDKLQQAFTVAEGGFYKTFFGGKRRISQWEFRPTVGDDFRKIECFEILMFRLKKWGLLPNEKQSEAKKEEVPQNPNDKEQNTIVEDKKEPEAVKETVPQEYTQLSNGKELKKPTRTRRSKSDK